MKTITNASSALILYVNNNVQQRIQMVTVEHFKEVKAKLEECLKLKPKEQPWFEKHNKTKLSFDEVVENSPLAIALLGLHENQIGYMKLPDIQGGIHPVKIIQIF
jgi:hypothetical protein